MGTKYEEALAKARSGWPLEEIFPELKESEDERIRKWIIGIINEVRDDEDWCVQPKKCDEAIAWLEKQKETDHETYKTEREIWVESVISNTFPEQDGDFISEEDYRKMLRKTADNFYEMGRKQKEQKPVISGDDFAWIDELKHDLEHPEELDKKVEEALQQKPVGWSEEDEKMRNNIVAELEKHQKMNTLTANPSVSYSFQKYQNEIDWLRSLRPPFLPEDTVIFNKGVAEGRRLEREDNKREWSEQDIQCYDAVMDMITNALYLPCRPRAETVEWFKSLKNRGNSPKSNTNSPSWSEEDEKKINAIVGVLNYQATLCQERIAAVDGFMLDELIDWLKSLRPHWKPSKEQMGALNYAYCELFKRGDVDHNILGPFQNLIDTLSKL